MKTTSHANEGVLPPELNSEIAAFCCGDSLRHLALVNKEFQAHAEKLLYARVVVQTYQGRVGAIETLATNATKAGYVTFLSLDFSGKRWPTDSPTVEKLLTAGPALTNLKDFRIRLRYDLRNHVDGLDGMLSTGHFHLNTLFVDHYLDFNTILEGQNDLTVIGIFQVLSNGDAPVSLLKSVKGRSLLTVGLEQGGYLPYYNNVDLVPELLSLEQAQNFDTIFNQAFEGDDMGAVFTKAKRVTTAFVYLQDVPSREIFEAFIAAASRIFVNLRELQLRLGRMDDTLEEWRKIPVVWPSTLTKISLWSWSPGDLPSTRGCQYSGSPAGFMNALSE
ncbi:hypothetical protein DFP72DRAFT_621640 [Ephemerocybe angulata]|uniref:F-box domain-containing protein n=1 Tax=Ephemerocybe angulata TaxID=980116 RepID=A0A8H6HJ68_9AGAR|nr:hypothetical protein DFP72DRAFT_621640 [Tulosesus angulatus]